MSVAERQRQRERGREAGKFFVRMRMRGEEPHPVLLTPTTVVEIDARRKITCEAVNLDILRDINHHENSKFLRIL